MRRRIGIRKGGTHKQKLSNAAGLDQGIEVPNDEEWYKGKAQAYATLAKAARNSRPRLIDPLHETNEAKVESAESQIHAVQLLSESVLHTNLLQVRSYLLSNS